MIEARVQSTCPKSAAQRDGQRRGHTTIRRRSNMVRSASASHSLPSKRHRSKDATPWTICSLLVEWPRISAWSSRNRSDQRRSRSEARPRVHRVARCASRSTETHTERSKGSGSGEFIPAPRQGDLGRIFGARRGGHKVIMVAPNLVRFLQTFREEKVRAETTEKGCDHTNLKRNSTD